MLTSFKIGEGGREGRWSWGGRLFWVTDQGEEQEAGRLDIAQCRSFVLATAIR